MSDKSEYGIRDHREKGLLEAHENGEVTGRITYFVLDDDPAALVAGYAAKWAGRHPDEAPAASPEVVAAAREQLEAEPHRR
ncbi:hypothetical protein ACIBCM_04975 [Streptomyces sp. NPDC051018]|uniref:hypothetical protein n=1 Tax=Streptomyces sp. NPDC051018 TaxID=3365639 RepID=UPI00379A4AF7